MLKEMKRRKNVLKKELSLLHREIFFTKEQYFIFNGICMFLKTIISNLERIQVVIKLQTNTLNESKCSSIITFWHIREKNYMKTIKSNELIYILVSRSFGKIN